MFIDARKFPKGQVNTDLCIIGGGAAAISMALQFVNDRFSVIVLESGGYHRESATQALYEGDNVGTPYDLSGTRSRFLGGSSNCWAGWCRPLDFHDFQPRSWVAGSGWPFSRDELTPYYHGAQSILQLGRFDYDPISWEKKLSRHKASFLKLSGSEVDNIVDQISPPAHLGALNRTTLAAASNVRIFLHANATEIQSDPNGTKVEKVHAATLTGNTFSVVARVVVLATGGIENARLLLASRRFQPDGLGNKNDIVGRYFMEHPRVGSLRVRLPPNCDRRLYDHSFALVRQRLKIPRMPIAVHFAPTESQQRRVNITNSRTYLVASSFDRLLAIARSVKALAHSGKARLIAASEIARNTPAGTLAALDFVFNLKSLPREYHLETVVEPIPNRDSRVTLGAEKDQLGMNKVRLHWRLTKTDKQNWITSVETVVAEMKKQGFLFVDPTKELGEFWDANIQWCWHHMGTTRMDPDPAKGVVDANCRVHGISNLFVAGSSVFPTAGSDTPTLTIVALALRLSSHLKSVLTKVYSEQSIAVEN